MLFTVQALTNTAFIGVGTPADMVYTLVADNSMTEGNRNRPFTKKPEKRSRCHIINYLDLFEYNMKFNFANTRLYVDDYDRCLEFYRDILGLEVAMISQVDRYVELATGSTKLTIMCRGKIKEYFGSRTAVSFGQQDDAIALSFACKT